MTMLDDVYSDIEAEDREHERRLREDRRYRWRSAVRGFYYGCTSRWYSFRSALFRSHTYRRLWQRITRGWDDSDTWNLDTTFAAYMLPRLRRYRKLANRHLVIEPERDARMAIAIAALTILADGRWYDQRPESHDSQTIERGLRIIAEDLQRWWW